MIRLKDILNETETVKKWPEKRVRIGYGTYVITREITRWEMDPRKKRSKDDPDYWRTIDSTTVWDGYKVLLTINGDAENPSKKMEYRVGWYEGDHEQYTLRTTFNSWDKAYKAAEEVIKKGKAWR